MNANMLCFCKQAPRLLLHGIAVCRCRHLIYRQAMFAPPSFMPSTLGNLGGIGGTPTWQATADANARRALVREAKQRIGGDHTLVPYEDVRDATEAARMVGENMFATDLEYEQWVASLEE